MNRLAWCAAAIAAICMFAGGCKKGEPGFELDSTSNQSMNQSDTETVKISIDRKGGFNGPVTVELSGLPAGVTVEGGNSHTMDGKDSSINLKLLASDSAATGDNHSVTVRVSATVDGRNMVKENVFNLKVKARS